MRFRFYSMKTGWVEIIGRVRRDERGRLLVRKDGDTYVLVRDFRQINRSLQDLQFIPPDELSLGQRHLEDGVA